ncbi:MAG TPA: DUF4038 domain-containing protein [Candidatus Saccharimonadia bacterium]
MTIFRHPWRFSHHWRRPGKRLAVLAGGLAVALVAVGWLAVTRTHAGAYVYPLKVSTNKRYLVDQNNKAFPLTVDTAWTWLAAVPTRSEADEYLDDRKSQGFNTIISNMFGWDTRNHSRAGVQAFSNGDLSQPNDAYFTLIDQLLQDAAARNMVVMMLPITLGDNGTDDPGGVPPADQWTALGTYVANRYKNYDNIIWVMGGDHDVQQTWDDTTDYTPYIDAMANAIKAADPRHLITYHPALDTFVLGGKSWFDFYAYQENRADSAPWSYDRTASYYGHSPVHPVINLEPGYETGDALTGVATTPYMVRRNAWWSFLAGALGVTYGGNRATWNIDSDGADWRSYVDLPGAKQTGYIPQILEKFAWEKLEPNGGPGNGQGHIAWGKAPDNSLLMAYLPQGGSVTVDTSGMSGATAEWYDPSNGQLHGAASGSDTYQAPGPNSAGNNDWLLVVHTPAGLASGQNGGTPTPAPTATPVPTPTPAPTATPAPTLSPAPGGTTPTPAPSAAPASTGTPVADIPGDLNHSGTVDISDLTILLTDWDSGTGAADVNHDGATDVYDLSTLLSHWQP